MSITLLPERRCLFWPVTFAVLATDEGGTLELIVVHRFGPTNVFDKKPTAIASQLPGMPEMLEKLEASGPRSAAALLARARERLNDGLNSVVHGGIHPFARHQDGYPISLLMDVLKNGNAMAMLTLNVLSSLPQQAEAIVLVRALHHQFEEVLPTLESFPAPTGSA